MSKKPYRQGIIKRVAALLLTLCLLPLTGLAEVETPVTRSVFQLTTALHADAFPSDGRYAYADWEAFLQKLSLKGTVDLCNWPDMDDRIYFDGGLYIGDGETAAIPFEYDAYTNFRYIRSKALGGASVFFQMDNIFEFLQKPYFYMGLPTPYLSLLLYPEATTWFVDQYCQPVLALTAGTGTRTVTYEDLRTLLIDLNEVANDESGFEFVYFYLSSILIDIGGIDHAMDGLYALEDWLDFLDPERKGLTITVDSDQEVWTIGGHTLLTSTMNPDGRKEFVMVLPDSTGYALNITYLCGSKQSAYDLSIALSVLDGESDERVRLAVDFSGLPGNTDLEALGMASVTLSGSALTAEIKPIVFTYYYMREALEPPFSTLLTLNWMHPDTGLAALSFQYIANITTHEPSLMIDRPYDNQRDIFSLDDFSLQEYKERFIPTMAASFLPILLQMHGGILTDVIQFLKDSGIGLMLGIVQEGE